MDVFAALADPVRRSIVRHLGRGAARVVDLTHAQEISRPAVSRHLRLLTEAGLCTAEARGRERHYRLDRSALTAVQDFLAELELPTPPFDERALDGLELEVHRTVRDTAHHPEKENTA